MDFDKSEVFCMGNYVRKDFDFELVEKERFVCREQIFPFVKGKKNLLIKFSYIAIL